MLLTEAERAVLRDAEDQTEFGKIRAFAEKHRVKTRRDSCGELLIPGKQFCTDMPQRVDYRSHVYEYGDARFGLCLLLASKRRWTFAKRKLMDAGFELAQDGDQEGCGLFNPADTKQVRLAFRLARIRPRHVMSPERRQELADRLRKAKDSKRVPVAEGMRR